MEYLVHHVRRGQDVLGTLWSTREGWQELGRSSRRPAL